MTPQLKFKLTSIASLYSKHARQMGIKTLPHDTLRTYLKNHKHFIGISQGERFQTLGYSKEHNEPACESHVTTAFCFDYSKLNINLEREIESPTLA